MTKVKFSRAIIRNSSIVLFYAGAIISAIAQYKTGDYSYIASCVLAAIGTFILIKSLRGEANT
jgi:uncharacterized membrane protein YoaK (UPF0700 family)